MDVRTNRQIALSLLVVPMIMVAARSGRVVACTHGDPPANEQYTWKRTLYGAPSDIVVSQIVKKYAATAFHYKTETCPLQVQNVWDTDYRREPHYQEYCPVCGGQRWVWWWKPYTDYHDCTHCCAWSGVGVTRAAGHYCEWDMRSLGPTSAK